MTYISSMGSAIVDSTDEIRLNNPMKKKLKKNSAKFGEPIYRLGTAKFKKFMAISNPMKQAALAGNARSITGVTPLYNADGPSLRINSRNTSRIPFG